MITPHHFAPWVSDDAREMFRSETAAAPPPASDIASLRAHYDDYNRRHLATARRTYSVEIERNELGGVAVDIVSPTGGATNDRTLICLHGGAFMWGRGAGALLEAVPVAATMGVRVVAVEYALAPEDAYPAAVNDVLSVYDALGKSTDPASIGIYGCSAGAVLTAQSAARLIVKGGEMPGAVAMLCGAGLEMAGDSALTVGILTGNPDAAAPDLAELPYFSTCSVDDPLVFPGHHPEILACFPPALLVTGTRDFAASSVMTMHRRMVGAGAQAELLCFDGMWHAFHMATAIPEARETFATLARFFDHHLR